MKKLPSEICSMTLPQAEDIWEYWRSSPPEHELIAMLARVYTTWEPQSEVPQNEAEAQVAHRKSLEARWKSGAMTAKDLFEATGGVLSTNVGNK